MDLLRTGIGISKTLKNVGRSKEIVSVFARNGFDELIIKTGIHTKFPGIVLPKKRIELALGDKEYHGDDWWRSIGYRLRKSFEELGPSFIKLGQLLSTREDIFPAPFIRQMKLLQNKANPIPFIESRKIIEEQLGSKLEDIFEEVDEDPIGLASIGVVYKGKLKSGEEVVIKVRRPGIRPLIETDFDILTFLVTQIEKVSPDFKYMGARRVLEDFKKSIQLELNFLLEARNCEQLTSNLKRLDKNKIFHLPKVYNDISSEKVLVLEFLKGKHFNEISSQGELSGEMRENLQESVAIFIHTLLTDGFFHADLHGGNFMLLENDKIGIIDFGLMGNLSKKNRTNLVAILYALVTNNYENLVYELLDVAEYDKIPNEDLLIRDIRDSLMPFVGLSIQETNVSELVSAIITTLSKHRLFLPGEWFVIFRALMTLDGVGKGIGLDMNIFKLIQGEIDEIIGELFSKNNAAEELMWVGRDALNTLKMLPRHVRWFLKESSKRNYALEINLNGHEKHLSNISKGLHFLGDSFLMSFLVLTGALFLLNIEVKTISDVPTISWIFWSGAFAILIRSLFRQRS